MPRRDLADGRIVYDGIMTDVTHRRQVEEELRQSEERFRLAAEAVNGIIYDNDPMTDYVQRTMGLVAVLGYLPEEAPPTGAWWKAQIHPDDSALIMQKSPDRDTSDRAVNEYRVRHRDGYYIYVLDRCIAVRDSAGEIVRMVVVFRI